MVSLEKLAENLQESLNQAEGMKTLNSIIPNTKFVFRISVDTAEKTPAVRVENTNEVIYTIDGIMSLDDYDPNGQSKETFSATMSTSVELLIPLANIPMLGENKAKKKTSALVDAVRSIVEKSFTFNKAENITDGEGNTYYMLAQYGWGATGLREMRNTVGDSMTMTLYVDYTFVYAGIGSDSVEITMKPIVNPEQPAITVLVPRSGIMREVTGEGNTKFNNNGIASFVPESSALTISFDRPVKNTELDYWINKFILTGEIQKFQVNIKIPMPNKSNANRSITGTYNMIFTNGTLSLATGLTASNAITMVEVFENVL